MAEWMFRTFGEEFGPVLGTEIHAMIRAGGLGPDDEVRPVQSDRWLRVADLNPNKSWESLSDSQAIQTQTACPNCRSFVRVDAEDLGQPIECTTCDQSFVVTRIARHRENRPHGGISLQVEDSSSSSASHKRDLTPRTKQTSKPDVPPQSSGNPNSADRPQQIGRFQLRETLGSGAFGVVYRAFDPSLDRVVALKIPRFGRQIDREVRRFLAEAKSAARLRHPNIVAVHETGQADGHYFIAYEFIPGETLEEHVKSDRPDFRTIASWVRELSNALAYAEEMGIVHRDIKPANVLMDASGHPQIADFGLAKRLDDESSMTADGNPVGTPAYMAPEQARGEQKNVGPKSDQYSLGVVLYELLTGQRPYRGGAHAVIVDVGDPNHEPEPAQNINPQVPLDLAAICGKAMEKDPVRRYATARELSEDLDRWSDGSPVIARPPRTWERAAKWVRRNPYVSLTAVVTAVALVVVTGLLLKTNAALQLAESEGTRADLNDVRAVTEATQRKQMAADLDQLQIEQQEISEAKDEVEADLQRVDELRQQLEGEQQEANEELAEREMDVEREQALREQAIQGREIGIAFAEAMRVFERAGDLCERGHVGEGLLWMTQALSQLEDVDIPNEKHSAIRTKILQSFASYQIRMAQLDEIVATRFSKADMSPDEPVDLEQADDANADLSPNQINMGKNKADRAQREQQQTRLQSLSQSASEFVREVDVRIGGLSFADLDKQWSADGEVFLTWDNRREKFVRHPEPTVPNRTLELPVGTIVLNSTVEHELKVKVDSDLKINSSALAPNGGALAAAGVWSGWQQSDRLLPPVFMEQGNLAVWRRKADGTFRPEFSLMDFGPFPLDFVTFSRNGDAVLATSKETLYVRDAVAGTEQLEPLVFEAPIDFVVTDSTTRRLVVVCHDTAWIYDIASATRTPLRHPQPVRSASVSPNDQLVTTSADDQKVRVWDIDSLEEVMFPSFHPKTLVTGAFVEDMSRFVTVDGLGTVRAWRLPARNAELESDDSRTLRIGTPVAAKFSPDARWLLISALSGQRNEQSSLHLIDATTGSVSAPPMEHDFTISGIGFAPSGRLFYSISNNAVRIWETNGADEVDLPFRHTSRPVDVSVAFDDTQFASVTDDRLFVWNLFNHRVFFESPVTSRPSSVAFHPDGRTVAVGCADRQVRFWSLDSNSLLETTLSFSEPTTTLRYDDSGEWLAAGTSTGRVLRRGLADGALIGEPLRHPSNQQIRTLAIDRNGKRIMAGTTAGVCVWDIETGAILRESIRAQQSEVTVAASADGTKLLFNNKLSQTNFSTPVSESNLPLWASVRTGMTLEDGNVRFLDEAEWSIQRALLAGVEPVKEPVHGEAAVAFATKPRPKFPATADAQSYYTSMIKMLETGVLAAKWSLRTAQVHQRNAAALVADDPQLTYSAGLCFLRNGKKKEALREFYAAAQHEGYVFIPAWKAYIYRQLREGEYVDGIEHAMVFARRLPLQLKEWPNTPDRMSAAEWLGRVFGFLQLDENGDVTDEERKLARTQTEEVARILSPGQRTAFNAGLAAVNLDYTEIKAGQEARQAEFDERQRRKSLQAAENLETRKDRASQKQEAVKQHLDDFEKKIRQQVADLNTELREMIADHAALKNKAREAFRNDATVNRGFDYEIEASYLNYNINSKLKKRQRLFDSYHRGTGKLLATDKELENELRILSQKQKASPAIRGRTTRRRTTSITLMNSVDFDVKVEAEELVAELKSQLASDR